MKNKSLLVSRVFVLMLASVIGVATARGEKSGTTVRGGGQAVVCDTGSVRFLDLYEGESVYGIKFNEGIVRTNFYGISSPYAVPQELASSVAQVLKDSGLPLAPFRDPLKQLEKYVNEVRLSILPRPFFGLFGLYLTAGQLPYIGDSGTLLSELPPSCHLQQIAVNNWEKNQVTILRSFFEQLSTVDASALLIHEVFHSMFVSQRNKTAVRQFVQYVMAPKWFQEKHRDAFANMVHTQKAIVGGYPN